MLAQSLINMGESFQIFTLMLFFIGVFFELLIFYTLDKYSEFKALFNIGSIIIKIMYIITGLMNVFIFWLATIFTYVYIWIVWLKFSRRLNYDIIQISNFCFIFAFLSLTMLFLVEINIFFILVSLPIIFLVSIYIYTYISNKRKALIYREQAKESFKNENYKETWALLSSSLAFASKMSPTASFSYHNTILKRHIKTELRNLSIVKDEEEGKKPSILVFVEPIISKSDLIRYLIFFIFATMLQLILILFIIS